MTIQRRMPTGRRAGVLLAVAAMLASVAFVVSIRTSAAAPSALSITVTSAPTSAATYQAVAFRVTVTNTGASAATGVTLTDTMSGASSTGPYPIQLPDDGQPVTTSNLGSCTFANPDETCTAASIAAGQVWTVTFTVGVTAAAGAAYADTATVSGTESGATVGATATTTANASQNLPPGFVQTKLAGGLDKPVVVVPMPNGDVYIGEQVGKILDYHNGAVLPTPVLTLNVFNVGETGLLGVALDPNFATNGYIYVSYTVPITVAGVVKPYARLSRFTVVNGVASTTSEKVYYQGNQIQNEDGTGGNYDHPGNQVKIGPDGKLWWSVGDNVPSISNGQALSNIYGKILRFNLDGTVPSDNPFVNVAGAVPYIYAYGLRNPWRFTFLPNGKAMTEDTGSSYWEDLDTIQAGTNFGWPIKEGNCGSCGFANPAYSYGHYPTDAAASAIAAYSGSTFPKAYDNVVFFGDYVRNDIEAVTFDPTYQTEVSDTVFDDNAPTIADLEEGPNGNLYMASVFGDSIYEITAPGPFPPTPAPPAPPSGGPTASITAPSNYNAGQTVSFSGTATDPTDGVLPARDYTWKVDFISHGVVQPSYFAEVADPFYGPVTGATSGSVTIPTDPSQVPGSFYRITLTVTDSLGLQTAVTKDIQPNLTSWSAKTSVPGAGYSVDGSWQTGTYTTQDVVGVVHVLTGMTNAQTVGGVRYRFAGWADGSALTDTITAGSGPGTYTADYEAAPNTVPSPWQSTDVGAPITAGTADYAPGSQSFYLDGSGADEFGVNDQSHYVYQTLSGDGTIVARVRYQTNTSSWAKAGVMIRQSTTAGAPFVDALVSPDVSPNTPNVNGVGCDADGCFSPLPPVTPAMGNGARMQYSNSGSKTPASYPAGFTDPNKWLKLQKVGNTFTSWLSSDGVHWTQIGVATVAMTGPVTIGLFDTAHNIGETSTAAFDNVSVTPSTGPPPPGPLPKPWVDTDVGSPAIAGSAGYTNGVFTVNGSGADIWQTNDQFNYVNQPATGSGTIVARVTSQTNTSSNAKAGVMFKQSTTAGSSYILIATAPNGVVKVQYDFNGSFTESTYTFPNVWMKLSWESGKFTASLSSDGTTWTPVLSNKTLPITSPATVGLFECSHNTSALGTATFDNVSYTSP